MSSKTPAEPDPSRRAVPESLEPLAAAGGDMTGRGEKRDEGKRSRETAANNFIGQLGDLNLSDNGIVFAHRRQQHVNPLRKKDKVGAVIPTSNPATPDRFFEQKKLYIVLGKFDSSSSSYKAFSLLNIERRGDGVGLHKTLCERLYTRGKEKRRELKRKTRMKMRERHRRAESW